MKTREKYGMSLQLSIVLVTSSISPIDWGKTFKKPTNTMASTLKIDMNVLNNPIVVFLVNFFR